MIRWLKCLICLLSFLASPPARAHIGSPNVIYEGLAGPYHVRVIVRPPGVIPGLADINVRVLSGEPATVSVLPVRSDIGKSLAPPPDIAKPVAGEANLYSAQLWLMTSGAYNIVVNLEGKQGEGRTVVPVNSVATTRLNMPKWFGGLLLVVAGGLFLALVTLVGAAARESGLPAGELPSRRHQIRAVLSMVASFVVLWREVWVESQAPASSVDSIIRCLLQRDILRQGDDPTSIGYARNLVFAIIGWQTMLYHPDMGSCDHGQLAIADETNGHCDHAHLCLRQDQSACKRPLCEFLKGFGVMLPCRNFGAAFSDEDKEAFRKCSNLSSSSLNAHLLTKVGRIHIKWTDVLACHLELDRTTNTLYLFRYPSFCAVHLQAQKPEPSNTTLHACAAPPGTVAHWATVDEVNDLLQEVLLSFRLLFGQDKTSRKHFRETHPFDGTPEKYRDEVLMSLCGRKQCSPNYGLRERDIYDLQHDFPILRSRIAVLMNHFSNIRPRTWRELWDDKRDSASWYTFWLVLIIGGVGILLAFLQVVFQIVQTILQIRQS